MTQSPSRPRRLPMLGHTQGTRSATVCHWRCADQCATAHPPRSESPVFAEVARQAIGRRSLLGAGLGSALVLGGSTALAGPAAATTSSPCRRATTGPRSWPGATP